MYKENRKQNCLLISHNYITFCGSLFVRAGRFLHKRERSKFKLSAGGQTVVWEILVYIRQFL